MKTYILISALVALIASTNGLPRRIKRLNNALGIPKESEVLWDILDIANLTIKVDGLESLLADVETALNERDSVIMALNTSTTLLQALVNTQAGQIAILENEVIQNLANITANSEQVASNEADIIAVSADSSANAAGISSNTADIETIATDVATNTAGISSNTADIATIVTDVATNTDGISSNTAVISSNTADIGTIFTEVATNTGDIASNVANIASNQVDVQSNLQSILNISADVVVNTANISLNADAITELTEGKPSISCEDMVYNTFTSYKRLRTRYDGISSNWNSDMTGFNQPSYPGGTSDDWYGEGWYRFTGSAGNKLATSIVENYYCGTRVGGYLQGGSASEPSIAGAIVNATVCFWWQSSRPCYYSCEIQIRHCPGFLLYYLPEAPDSPQGRVPAAYCGQQ